MRHRLYRTIAALSIVALISSVTVGPALAMATDPPLSVGASVQILQAYDVVDRRPEAELRLGDPVTRAEVAKILGAALKAKAEADQLQGEAAFADTAGHWANGWIAVARNKGLFQGRDDGRFDPQAPVTPAELVTALLRLTGRGREAAFDWPIGAIVAASELKMIPADMNLTGRMNLPATRGEVFRITATALSRVPVLGGTRSTLQNVFDQTPTVLKLTGFPNVTGRHNPVVTGEAGDAVYVLINGQMADVQPGGRFSHQLSLKAGENRLEVVAVDAAGNRTVATAAITYQRAVRAAVLPAMVEAGAGVPFTLSVVTYDAAGQALPAEGVTWNYDTTAFTQDSATGRFTPVKPGRFTFKATTPDGLSAEAVVHAAGEPAQLELSIDRSTLVAGGAPTPVRIRVLDEAGRLNTAAKLSVQLSVVPTGLAVLDSTTVTTDGGTGVVYLTPGSTLGGFGIQAKSKPAGGKTEIVSPMLPVLVEARRVAGIQLQTLPQHVDLSPGRKISVVATAVDQVGAPIAVREDTVFGLRTTSPFSVTQGSILIRSGAATSDVGGRNGELVTLGGAGTAQVTAAISGMEVTAAAVSAAASSTMAGLSVQVLREVARADDLSATLVAVSRVDAQGRVVTGDRTPVVLISQNTGISVTPLHDAGGVVTYAIRSASAGRFSLTAGVPGRPEMNSTPARVAFVSTSGTPAKPVISVGTKSVRAGDGVPVSVILQDSAGPMPNPGPPLIFQLQSSAAGILSKSEVVIPTGSSRSEEVLLNVGQVAKNVSLTGSMVGGKALTTVSLSVTVPVTGQPAQPVQGAHLALVGPAYSRSQVAGEETRFVVQARNGEQIRRGAYAFGLKVRLNGQELTSFPPDLQVTIGRRSVLEGAMRTAQGEAEIWVKYTGTGVIELEPVPSDMLGYAYDQFGAAGTGRSTAGEKVVAARATYVAGPLKRAEVTVSPASGDSLQALIKAAPGRSATVRIRPVDAYGNTVLAGCTATLSRASGSSANLMALRLPWGDLPEHSEALDNRGVSTFTIVALTDSPGWTEWVPSLVCGRTVLTTPTNIRVTAATGLPTTPVIAYAGGRNSSVVAADESGLQVQIAHSTVAQGAAEVLVYNGDTFIGRFGPVYQRDASAVRRTVTIPRTLLNAGGMALRIRLDSGAGVSDESSTWWVYIQ